jgi:transposase-like protein
MTPEEENSEEQTNGQISGEEFRHMLAEKMKAAVRLRLIATLEAEIDEYVGASAYERVATRRDRRNGYRYRDLGTTVGMIEDLRVPRTRQGYQTQVFEKYQRRQAELDASIGEMFVKGISTAQVGVVLEKLNGMKPSASAVSRVFHGLEAEYEAWKKRGLLSRYVYVFADGTYFSVIYGTEGHKMPVLALIGITPEGKREVIAFTTGERENQAAWEDLLADIKERGVQVVDLWITDGGQAMINAITVQFPSSKRQRCMKHKMENVLSHVPDKQRDAVAGEFKAIFYQENRTKADQCAVAFRAKYRTLYPAAIDCMERDWEACLTFYQFPQAHWLRIRTSNVIERLFEETKKRSKKMSAAFRNEGSCLLLFYAVVRSLKFQNVVMSAR